MRDVLTFISHMKEIESVHTIQGDTPKVLCMLLENPVIVHKDNQGAIKLAVTLQM